MGAQYALQKIVVAFIYLALTTLTIFIVAASTISKSGLIFGVSLINLVFFGVPSIAQLILVFGALHAVFAKSIKILFTWLAVLLACIPVLFLFYKYAMECGVSNEIKRQIFTRLSASEISSLSSPETVCPTFYSYRMHGNGESAVVTGASDFIHGTKVWFGTQ